MRHIGTQLIETPRLLLRILDPDCSMFLHRMVSMSTRYLLAQFLHLHVYIAYPHNFSFFVLGGCYNVIYIKSIREE
jgi:hypothetical protein